MNRGRIALLAASLALITSPAYSADTVESTQFREAVVLVSSVKTLVAEFYMSNGYFPTDLNAMGYPVTTSGQYVQSIVIDPTRPGALVTTFRTNSVFPALAGKSFALAPVEDATPLTWQCTESNIQSPYLTDYCNSNQNTQANELLTVLSGLRAAVTEYYFNEGKLPVSNRQAGLSDTISTQYVASVVVSPDGSGTLIGTMKLEGVHPDIAGKQLLYTPINRGYALEWRCGYSTFSPEYLPSICNN